MKPVHPILVHFPVALVPLAAVAEVIGFLVPAPSLSQAGAWAIGAAAVIAIPTAAAGWFDMLRAPLSDEVHRHVHRHRAVGLVLTAILLALAAWRAWLFFQSSSVSMFYLDALVLTAALTAFQGWLGGELVYRHGVSVRLPDAEDKEQSASHGKAKSRGESHTHHH